MSKQSGTISNWNEKKGYGFITPTSGGKLIFAHISDYSRAHKAPIKGLNVHFLISSDAKGRKCAVEVRPLQGHRRSSRQLQQRIGSLLLFGVFAILLVALFKLSLIPLALVGFYAVMSVIAYVTYTRDKSAAQSGAWRISESTLHSLALMGGWPGAALAQSFLRHKSKKFSFKVIYWITVIVNCSLLYWLVSAEGSFWLRRMLSNIL